ncbi:hypothetical protein LCGC14_0384200 [marine sediment metagenome]|uniref:Uncharacterized protein n=1 Tax=marine sediment metagenome TaxID=412755 RepID=A0A0F9VNI8_9ZZZZ
MENSGGITASNGVVIPDDVWMDANTLLITGGTYESNSVLAWDSADVTISTELHLGEYRFTQEGEVIGPDWEYRMEEVAVHLQTHHKQEGIMVDSIGGVLGVMLICIITVKVIIPRLTIGRMVKVIRDRLWRPTKRVAEEVKNEWSE